MEKTPDDIGPEGSMAPNATWWHSDFLEKLESISLCSSEETLNCKESNSEHELEGLAARRASQTMWATGKISEPLPNGFYSMVPVSAYILIEGRTFGLHLKFLKYPSFFRNKNNV